MCLINLFLLMSQFRSTYAFEYKDVDAGKLIAIKRQFKIDLEECKKKWEIDKAEGSSSCVITQREPDIPDQEAPQIAADEKHFVCWPGEEAKRETASAAVKTDENELVSKSGGESCDKNERVMFEVKPHGNFGYMILANQAVEFLKIQDCLAKQIEKLPKGSISTTFIKLKE